MISAIAMKPAPAAVISPAAPPAADPSVYAFTAASAKYAAAIHSLTIQPNVRKDPAGMISTATTAATDAVTLLEPFTTSTDIFAKRNSTASIASAHEGIANLKSAALTLSEERDGISPFVPSGTFMNVAKNQFERAISVLWHESAPLPAE